MLQSAIYRGRVVHERVRPKRHRLRYSVFSLLLDLDELEELDRRFFIFGYNKRALISFYDSDHGPATGEPLRRWVEAQLNDAEITWDGGRIALLCYPRILGYVFNPLSVYFCYRRNGMLAAILYEVCNTFHERHTYIIPVEQSDQSVIRQNCQKKLYVSPFIAVEGEYKFRIRPPAQSINIGIIQSDAEGPMLTATFGGEREPLTGKSLTGCLARFPLLTFKIMAAIHWEALLLLFKGFRTFRHRPTTEAVQSSVGYHTKTNT